jgi:hypothetical protein
MRDAAPKDVRIIAADTRSPEKRKRICFSVTTTRHWLGQQPKIFRDQAQPGMRCSSVPGNHGIAVQQAREPWLQSDVPVGKTRSTT